jgi:hypothetical protein
MPYLDFLIAIMLLLIALGIGVKMVIGRTAYEHVKARLLYDLIKGLAKLPFRLIAFVVKLPKS